MAQSPYQQEGELKPKPRVIQFWEKYRKSIAVLFSTTTAMFVLFFLLFPVREKKGRRGLELGKREEVATVPYDTLKDRQYLLLSAKKKIEFLPPAADQMDQGSCVPFSLAYYLISYYEKMRGGYSYNIVNNVADRSRVFSPAFVYYAVKDLKKSTDCESGISFLSAFDFVGSKGATKWIDFPYDGNGNHCPAPPEGSLYPKASVYSGYVFYRIKRELDNLKGYIQTGYPIIVGINTSKNMDRDGYRHKKLKGPFIWDPQRHDTDAYHAILCVGFDDTLQCFILLNSWGLEWGADGYCYVPYNVFFSRARELYIAKIKRPSFLLEQKLYESALERSLHDQMSDSARRNSSVLYQLSGETDSLLRADLEELRGIQTKNEGQQLRQQQLEQYFASGKMPE